MSTEGGVVVIIVVVLQTGYLQKRFMSAKPRHIFIQISIVAGLTEQKKRSSPDMSLQNEE